MKNQKAFLRKKFNFSKFVIIFLYIFIHSSVFSQNFGTNTAEFLKIKPEARTAATGESGIAVADGTNTLIFNPSRLSLLDRSELTLGEILWFNNIHMEYAAFAFPFEKGTGLGLSIFYINLGDFDSTGSLVEKVDIQNAFINFGFGQSFGDGISLGICGKGIYENFIDEKSFGLSFDFVIFPSISFTLKS